MLQDLLSFATVSLAPILTEKFEKSSCSRDPMSLSTMNLPFNEPTGQPLPAYCIERNLMPSGFCGLEPCGRAVTNIEKKKMIIGAVIIAN